MADKKKIGDIFAPVFAMGSLFVIIDLLALSIACLFEADGIVAFADPNDPLNIVYLFLTLLVFTLVILLIAKFRKKQLIRAIVLVSTGLLIFIMFFPLLIILIPETWALFLSLVSVVFLISALVKYPEWYIVDLCCIIMGGGAAAMLGVSLSVSLVIILLVGLALYDAISVYKTKHMIDLADTLLDLRLPVILVLPRIKKYSLIKDTKSLKEKLKDNEERDAFIMGLGDIIMPGILVTSSFYNLPANNIIVSLSVMGGTLLGFALLIFSVIKGKPQAGLPYLCGGAIFGYILSSYILFGRLVGLFLA